MFLVIRGGYYPANNYIKLDIQKVPSAIVLGNGKEDILVAG